MVVPILLEGPARAAAPPSAWGGALLGVVIVSAIPLAVALLLPREEAALRRLVRWLVAFAAGALLGAAFLHLIPDAFSSPAMGRWAGVLVVAGFFGFFGMERYVWRHGHRAPPDGPPRLPPLAAVNVVGDALHNALDGMAIAAAFLAGPSLGMATTLAVVLHEVPQEIGDVGILLHAGLSRRRAILWNLGSALVSFVGAVIVLVVGAFLEGAAAALIPIAAGGFIYIAASDLVPELQEETREGTTGALLFTMALGLGAAALPLQLGPR